MNTNCTSFKGQLLESITEGHVFLSEAMHKHADTCKDCQHFYNTLKVQLEQLETEKHTEINPYLAAKILLKTSETKNTTGYRRSFTKSALSFACVVLASVLVGIGINNFLYTGDDDNSEQGVSATTNSAEDDTQNEITKNTDTDILTLND